MVYFRIDLIWSCVPASKSPTSIISNHKFHIFVHSIFPYQMQFLAGSSTGHRSNDKIWSMHQAQTRATLHAMCIISAKREKSIGFMCTRAMHIIKIMSLNRKLFENRSVLCAVLSCAMLAQPQIVESSNLNYDFFSERSQIAKWYSETTKTTTYS